MKSSCIPFLAPVLCFVAVTAEGVVPAPPVRSYPAKGEPFPAYGRHAAYEDVLDHCDLVLTGKVTQQHTGQPKTSASQPEVPSHIRLAVTRVMYGTCTNKVADILHGPGYIGKLNDTNRVYVFMCLVSPDGKIRLAGDPPRGGGHVAEGVSHMDALLEAKRDPVKGYRSKNWPVKFSSAYRLVQAWVKTPPKERALPPPGLVDLLVDGLWAYKHGLSRHGDATAWNAINDLFKCDIRAIWNYPPEMKKGRRSKLATDVGNAWKRTKVKVRERRAERANAPHPDGEEFSTRVKALIQQLGSDSYPKAQAAQDELVRIGKPALKMVQAGTKDPDPDVASGCRLLALLISQLRDFRPTQQSYVFNLDLAEPFVPIKSPEKDEDR